MTFNNDNYSVKQKITSIDSLIPVFCERLEAGQSVRFEPQGISMLPMIRQGIDSVVLSPVPSKLEKYDIPLYRRDNGQYVLHRIIDAGDTYTCIGDNQFVRETGLRHDQMIGVVTEFYRGEKHYTVNSTGYKIYCRVWNHSRRFRYFWKRVVNKLRRCLK